MIERDWRGLYSEGWQGEIVDEAFSHPAKFARGLIRKIYEHAFSQGWIKIGDVILDPFGGVALGAFDAALNGLNWLGVELEEKFVNLGNQNIDLWFSKYGPGVAVLDELRSRGKMPPYGIAQLIQGDSRQLVQILSMAQGVVSSPPYSKIRQDGGGKYAKAGKGGIRPYTNEPIDTWHTQRDQRNLGNLREGNFDAVVGSPNFPTDQPCASQTKAKKDYHAFTRGDGTKRDHIMRSEGNLGNLPQGDIKAVLGSPPHTGDALGHDAGCVRLDDKEDQRRATEGSKRRPGYGSTPGQLGKMRVVSSPPWEQTLNSKDKKFLNEKLLRGRKGSQKVGYGPYIYDAQDYGSTDGNIGNSAGGDFWTASAQIMHQSYSVLEAGSVAIWVLKGFVRNREYVDFPSQWRQLGEACGFETIEWIRAWLIETRGTQYDLFGNLQKRIIERKSFFRRLAERKGSPRIDYEIVLIQQKPAP